ncbi:membrane protein required for colicin V production [Paracoccus pantotrophus]|uniref:CvpA family protein n=1 Tax=Paracoccus pantotrophus TaxID=82367 RepID=A0A1I5GCT8_PARPN|nr:CvpA family protein [Paracoccus pantotrophus]MDF3855707.1 CvpA family protein [Paracoccus pantotrophus]QFG35383.1 CvpA family protein [Paracoccus pantotrophus]QLH13624.1 CvpA family protein [Paracoccus pantotrophus]RKS44410.1 membrane protein required for colicin V production [Paracoccus pantotrophus]RNI17092.1 CvpA family protein [Paracoccus pantotrophus]
MDGFTIIDGIVAAVIILSAILAYARGFVRESLAILGWIGAAVLAFIFAPTVRPMVAQVPGLNKFLADSCELATIAGFAAVFALALVLFSIITPLFSSVVQRSALGGVDQGMGFLFGVARGILLVAIAFIVYDRVMASQPVAVVDNSRSAQVFERMRGQMDQQIPQDAPGWVVSRYEQLVRSCAPTGQPVDAQTPTPAPAAPAN